MQLPLLALAFVVLWPFLVRAHGGHGNGNQQAGSRTEAQAAVEAHNKVRKSAKAVAMNKLTWSDELAANAALHSKTCTYAPSNDTHRKNIGRFASVGENTYFSTGRKASYSSAVKAWMAEAKNYDSASHTCVGGKRCQNYTQLVWWDTESVGCAATKCEMPSTKKPKSGYFIVCQYGPAGNKQDAAPFTKATSSSLICSQCPKGSVCLSRENLCSPPANSTLLPDHGSETDDKEPWITEEVDIEGEGV